MSFAPQQKTKGKEKLLERLATGKKQAVDKKEMKKLTQKNFQNLPEIKQKLDEERKQKEMLARKAQAQLQIKQLDERRRAALQRKKEREQLQQNES